MENLNDLLSSPIAIAAMALLAFVVGKLLFRADDRVEERRRHAVDIAGKLRGAGFERLPVFFEDYAVGDYSGMLRSLKDLHAVFANDEQRRQELQKVLRLLLTDLFRDPEKRPLLIKLIDDLKAANLPDAKSVIGDALGQLLGQPTMLEQLGGLRSLLGLHAGAITGSSPAGSQAPPAPAAAAGS